MIACDHYYFRKSLVASDKHRQIEVSAGGVQWAFANQEFRCSRAQIRTCVDVRVIRRKLPALSATHVRCRLSHPPRM